MQESEIQATMQSRQYT